MPDDIRPPNAFVGFLNSFFATLDAPAKVVKEKIVEPLQTKEPPKYYHRKFRRIPSIEECDVGDNVCFYETNEQFKRDRRIDNEIVNILRQRRLECEHFYGDDSKRFCQKVTEDFEEASNNYFIKYGDLGAKGSVLDAYMKQKHRLLWERRHGEVGTGMKPT